MAKVEIKRKCVICGSLWSVVKHHTAYRPERIIPLCRFCHDYLHTLIKKFKRLREYAEKHKKPRPLDLHPVDKEAWWDVAQLHSILIILKVMGKYGFSNFNEVEEGLGVDIESWIE